MNDIYFFMQKYFFFFFLPSTSIGLSRSILNMRKLSKTAANILFSTVIDTKVAGN